MKNFDLTKYLAEGRLFEQEQKDIEDVLLKAGFKFDDGLLGGVGSGGAGYYDWVNDDIYGYNQSGPWNEEEFSKFYDNFKSKNDFSSNTYEKEFSEENEDGINYDMVAQMVKPGIYSVGDDGYAEIYDNGNVEVFSKPRLADVDGSNWFDAWKMDDNGNAIAQFSKDELRKRLKDDMYYIL
jgi:hypothetical protein